MEQNNALARKFNAASLLRFALPNIAMMLLLSMYTIVDARTPLQKENEERLQHKCRGA